MASKPPAEAPMPATGKAYFAEILAVFLPDGVYLFVFLSKQSLS